MAEFERGEAAELRSESIKVRLSPNEKKRLDALAHGMGMSVASLVRFLCITNIKDTIVGGHSIDAWEKVRDYSLYRRELNRFSGEVARTRSDLNRLGNNVNQIARSLNAGASVGADMVRALDQSQQRLGDIYVCLDAMAEAADRLADTHERLGGE